MTAAHRVRAGWRSLATLARRSLFLAVPIVAIFTNASPARLLDALGEESAREALWLSLRTSLIAVAIIIVVGTPAAYLLATRQLPRPGAGR